jgi:hypothetical protein
MCEIILAAGFARGLLLLSRPRNKEGAGKAGCQPHPMASYAKGSHRTSIAVTTGGPSIRLSLHDRLYGLCRFSPGRHFQSVPSPRERLATSPSGRTALPSRSLTPLSAPASHGFAVRFLPRPSCLPPTIASIRDWASRPGEDRTTGPLQSASIVIRSTQAMMANAPR